MSECKEGASERASGGGSEGVCNFQRERGSKERGRESREAAGVSVYVCPAAAAAAAAAGILHAFASDGIVLRPLGAHRFRHPHPCIHSSACRQALQSLHGLLGLLC